MTSVWELLYLRSKAHKNINCMFDLIHLKQRKSHKEHYRIMEYVKLVAFQKVFPSSILLGWIPYPFGPQICSLLLEDEIAVLYQGPLWINLHLSNNSLLAAQSPRSHCLQFSFVCAFHLYLVDSIISIHKAGSARLPTVTIIKAITEPVSLILIFNQKFLSRSFRFTLKC